MLGIQAAKQRKLRLESRLLRLKPRLLRLESSLLTLKEPWLLRLLNLIPLVKPSQLLLHVLRLLRLLLLLVLKAVLVLVPSLLLLLVTSRVLALVTALEGVVHGWEGRGDKIGGLEETGT